MSLSRRAAQGQEALDRIGVSLRVVELPESTRTAGEAAAAVGCVVGQIAKSLVFRKHPSGQPVLVIARGDNRVDVDLLTQKLGEKIEIADADYVRQATGFSIGGVPPVGHASEIETYIDEQLFEFEQIWAAAGTPHAVFSLTPDQLQAVTQGEVLPIASA
jgi:prolyl-tRNA editing enzyme YbaK/EbsC (Cys-tRNA(Pro) deacylase)